jgi:hypothetical protein
MEYLQKIRFKGELAHLDESIRDFVEKCEGLNNQYEFSECEFRYLMLLSHFIDGEILTAIGTEPVPTT